MTIIRGLRGRVLYSTGRLGLEVLPLIALLSLSLPTILLAQDFRGVISGQVTDPYGAAISGATVRATNVETSEVRDVKTTAEGSYTIPYLNPGVYDLEVTAPGFHTLKREKIVLQVADKLNLTLKLQLGSVTETVTVTAQQEVLETGSADRGLVFDPIKTQEYPLNGRQTYMLLSLTPGVLFTQEQFGNSGFSGTRGWDVTNKYRINGAREGQNLFLLNGAPISANDGTWQLAPNVEAVQEFKVMTNTYDAQYGRFGGGVVNTTLKSGTSKWHGDVFEYFRNRVFDANYFQNNFVGDPVPKHNQHQWGGVVGGPIRKERDFIFASFEGWREIIGFPALSSVPPAALRAITDNIVNGTTIRGINFGALGYKIYDPLHVHPCGGSGEPCIGSNSSSYWRTEFPGDVLPESRINPVGQKILSYYPAANAPDPSLLSNNFVASGSVGRYKYHQPMVRWDHIISDRDKFYVLVTFQHGSEYRNHTGFPSPAGAGEAGSERTDQNYVLAWTHTLSATAVLDVRGSYGRFTSDFPRDTDFNLTADQLGIRQVFHAATFPKNTAPRVAVQGYSELFGCCDTLESWDTYNQWNFSPSLTMTHGKHTSHYGFEYNYVARGNNSYAYSNGNFDFAQSATRQFSNASDSQAGRVGTDGQHYGSGLATMLLGIPTGAWPSSSEPGTIADWNESGYRSRPYYGFYVQDDWRIAPKVTLNLGLRYEAQVPWIERFDRTNRGFDVAAKNPYSDAVLANWATNRANWTACGNLPPGTNCPSLGVTSDTAAAYPYPAPPAVLGGGFVFPGVNGQPRRLYDTDWTNIAPRAGVAWRVLPKTVLRAGGGVYYQSPTQNNTTTGFSQRTSYIGSPDSGQTFNACATDPVRCASGPYSLTTPFPQGVERAPGSSLGLTTNVGNSVSFDPGHLRNPRTYQYSLSLQRELPHAILAEASYAGNYQVHVTDSFNVGRWSLPDQTKAIADNNWLDQRMPNPFFGVIPLRGIGNSNTITRSNLLRPYPLFQEVTNNLVQDGHYRSDALQVKVEQRVLGGKTSGVLTWGISYTFSKEFEANHRLNNWNASEPLMHEVDSQDKPHSFAFHGVYDLPFGKDRGLLKDAVSTAIVGNWRFDWVFTYYSGFPVSWPNLQNRCGTWKAAVQDEDHWFNNDKTCYTDFPRNWVRTTPDRFSYIRNAAEPQLNLALEKTFRFGERYRFQFRGEGFNVMNTPIRPGPNTTFGDSDFGKLPKRQQNFPRVLQVAGKIYF